MTGMFGEVAGGWGEADTVSEGAGEVLPGGGVARFGSGLIKIDEEQWRALLHHPVVLDAVLARATDIADAANSMVAMDPKEVERLGKGEDPYMVTLQNRSDTTRARAQVKAANELGRLDDATNNTLYKASQQYPSDPKYPIPSGLDVALPPERLEAVVAAIEEIAGRYTPAASEPGSEEAGQ